MNTEYALKIQEAPYCSLPSLLVQILRVRYCRATEQILRKVSNTASLCTLQHYILCSATLHYYGTAHHDHVSFGPLWFAVGAAYMKFRFTLKMKYNHVLYF